MKDMVTVRRQPQRTQEKPAGGECGMKDMVTVRRQPQRTQETQHKMPSLDLSGDKRARECIYRIISMPYF